jgi:hypothetical protein
VKTVTFGVSGGVVFDMTDANARWTTRRGRLLLVALEAAKSC